MKKLFLSFAVILSLLILVSCPDGTIPSSILDISLVVAEDSEVGLDTFDKLSYQIKDVNSGIEINQIFETVTNLTIPVSATGEYEITVTGKAEDDDYTYECSGKGTVEVVEGQITTEIEIVLTTKKTLKDSIIKVSFIDEIKKSADYDLDISTFDFSYIIGEMAYHNENVEFSTGCSLDISIPGDMSEVEYSVSAKNKEGILIGEGSGSFSLEEGTESYSVSIKEKEGEGKLVISVVKNPSEEFPHVEIDGNEYDIALKGNSTTEGSIDIDLYNGTYRVKVGEEEKEVRIVAGFEKKLSFDFSGNVVQISFDNKIVEDSECNLAISKIDYSFPELGEEYTAAGVVYKNDFSVYVPKVNGTFEYSITAYNSESKVIGEGSGSITINNASKSFNLPIAEKSGDGTLVISAVKDSEGEFPKVQIGDKEYTITLKEDSTTEGSVNITLSNGNYTVKVGEEEKEVRIVFGMKKALDFNFSSPAIVTLSDCIPKYEGLDMNIDHVSYSIRSSNDSGRVYNGENITWTNDLQIPVSYMYGLWEYTISAYNKDGVLIGEADHGFIMKGWSETIKIEEKEGKGNVNISLKFNSDVLSPSASISGIEESVSLVKDGEEWKASINNIDSGTYILKTDGKEFVFRIVNGMTTEFSEDLRYDIDVDIDNEIVSSERFVIEPIGGPFSTSNISAMLYNEKGALAESVSINWYLGFTSLVSNGNYILDKDFETPVKPGVYTLKAVVYRSGKVIGIAACAVEFQN